MGHSFILHRVVLVISLGNLGRSGRSSVIVRVSWHSSHPRVFNNFLKAPIINIRLLLVSASIVACPTNRTRGIDLWYMISKLSRPLLRIFE